MITEPRRGLPATAPFPSSQLRPRSRLGASARQPSFDGPAASRSAHNARPPLPPRGSARMSPHTPTPERGSASPRARAPLPATSSATAVAPWRPPLASNRAGLYGSYESYERWASFGLDTLPSDDDEITEAAQLPPPHFIRALPGRMLPRIESVRDVDADNLSELFAFSAESQSSPLLEPYRQAADLARAQRVPGQAGSRTDVLATLAAFSALEGPVQSFFVDTKRSNIHGHVTLHFQPPHNSSFSRLIDYVADVLNGDATCRQLRFEVDPSSCCTLQVGQHDGRNGDLGRQVAAAVDAVKAHLTNMLEATFFGRDRSTRAWETLMALHTWAQQGTLMLPIRPPAPAPRVVCNSR